MNLTYEQAMDFLNQLPAFSPKAVADKTRVYNLDRIRILLERLGNPQEQLTCIHIAGTNGKGSTSAFLQNILTTTGYRTGSFNSPQLLRYTEQIRIDGIEIDQDSVARLMTTVKTYADAMDAEGIGCPSEFELTLTVAFLYFVEQRCDLVILEAGLGGTLDATNVIPAPLLTIITSISFDHMQMLGDTLPAIAEHKAGIIKPGTTVLLYPQQPEVTAVFTRVCREKGVALHHATLPVASQPHGLTEQEFTMPQDFLCPFCTACPTDINQRRSHTFALQMLGSYQPNNAAAALCACALLHTLGYPVALSHIKKGLYDTHWEGRFEVLAHNPVLIADGAHNVQGMEMLVQSLQQMFPERSILFVVGVLADKQYEPMMDLLLSVSTDFFVFAPPSPRALSGVALAGYLNNHGGHAVVADDAFAAVTMAHKRADASTVICACGSLYFIGQLKQQIRIQGESK